MPRQFGDNPWALNHPREFSCRFREWRVKERGRLAPVGFTRAPNDVYHKQCNVILYSSNENGRNYAKSYRLIGKVRLHHTDIYLSMNPYLCSRKTVN